MAARSFKREEDAGCVVIAADGRGTTRIICWVGWGTRSRVGMCGDPRGSALFRGQVATGRIVGSFLDPRTRVGSFTLHSSDTMVTKQSGDLEARR